MRNIKHLPRGSESMSQTGSYNPSDLLKPIALKKGDLIGIFTPSWPGHLVLKEKYQHGLKEIERAGFKYIEGSLTRSFESEGYRSGSPEARAQEFMELIRNPEVKCLIATIGGSNSSSMIPYLDFEEIRQSRKIIIGYSDMTSLHLAIGRYSGLSTFYGPAVVSTFGEYPHILNYSLDSFLDLACSTKEGKRKISPPSSWSNHFIDATKSNWKEIKREFVSNNSWRVLSEGEATAPIIVADLETLLTAAGTPHFPNLKGCILAIEEMDAPFNKEERNFRQLDLMGVFDVIEGLLISKPSHLDPQGAQFSYDALIMEIVGKRNYPIISNFDCGHTYPMITLSEGLKVSLDVTPSEANFYIDESAVVQDPLADTTKKVFI